MLSDSGDDVLYVSGGLSVSGVRYKHTFPDSCGNICYTFIQRYLNMIKLVEQS